MMVFRLTQFDQARPIYFDHLTSEGLNGRLFRVNFVKFYSPFHAVAWAFKDADF
jgi:hypothetical protein